MELIPAIIFIPAVIAGMTQLIKSLSDTVRGPITILVALVIGIFIALIDTEVGVQDINIAQGIMLAFGTIGIVGTVKMNGGGDTTRLNEIVTK